MPEPREPGRSNDEAEPPGGAPGLGPERYARWRATDVGELTERLERTLLLELVGEVAGKRVLDVGCGDGDLLIHLWSRGAIVTGIDASTAMATAAHVRAKAQGADIAVSAGSGELLPFPDGRFDIVLAVTVLCFVDDPDPFLREMARVVRPGGRVVIGELGRWNLWAAARRVRGWFGSPFWRRCRFRTARELRTLAERAGLAVTVVRGAVFYPRWRPAAWLMAPFDAAFGRLGCVGAAFIALSAVKPVR